MASTRIAVAQTTSHWDVDANIADLRQAVASARRDGAEMLFLPEMAGLLDRDRTRAAASITTPEASPYLAAAREAALTHKLWIHLGSLPVMGEDGRWRNRSMVIDATGEVAGVYDKIHLFDVSHPTGEIWRESAAYAPGDRLCVVEGTPVGRLGLAICYDLRFPELFIALRSAGAEVIAVPSAFTVPTGQAHWELLIRARALDSGCDIIAAAQTGIHADGRKTFGHSMVSDAWGNVVLDAGVEARVRICDLDASGRDRARDTLPTQIHRGARPIHL